MVTLPADFVSSKMQPVKSSLVYDLIFGNLRHAKEIWERSKLVGLSSPPNSVWVISIDNYAQVMSNKSEHRKQAVRQEFFQAVQESLKIASNSLFAMVAPDSIAVLLTLEQDQDTRNIKQALNGLAEQVKNSVEELCQMTVSVCIGNDYDDPRNLHLSYSEALYAQRHKFFIGNNRVIHIEDVEPFTRNVRPVSFEKESELFDKVQHADKQGARESMDKVLQEMLLYKNADPESLKMQALELLVVLARAARKGGADSKRLLSVQFQFASALQDIQVVQQLERWIYEVLDTYIDMILEEPNQYSYKAVRESIQFIEQNYHQDLTLEEVAKFVHLSTNYLSSIFKKQTGLTIVEYLTDVRTEKAKALLDDLENSVSQVAAKVGYNDPRYFSKVFRSVVGVTPLAYRNRI